MNSVSSVVKEQHQNRYLNEYDTSGAYHREFRMSNTWLPRYFRRFHVALSVLKMMLPLDARMADIGGGEGLFIQQLEREGFVNIVGLDPFAPFDNHRMIRGDVCNLPFADGSMDAIICFDVLEHIPLDRQARAAGELSRVLKSGGVAVISIPNMAHLKSRLQFLLTGRPWRNKLDKHPGELTAREREELLNSAGLKCIDKVGIHLTITTNPRPPTPFGRILSRIMFSASVPAGLCWTVVFLCCKPPVPALIRRLRHPLKKALRHYQPLEKDPTCR